MTLRPSIRPTAARETTRRAAGRSRRWYGLFGAVLIFASACGSDAAAATVDFDVVARGAVPRTGDAPKAAAKIVSSRAAAEKLLRDWDLERAEPKLAGIDFGKHRLVVLVARGSNTAARLDVRKITTSGTRLTATGKVKTGTGVVGGQAQSRPYTLVTVPRSVDATSARLLL